jgi:predicted transcriptional regulator
MERTTIMADPAVIERLKAMAREREVPFAVIVREALQEKASRHRPKPKSIGMFASGRGDISTTEALEPTPPESWP